MAIKRNMADMVKLLLEHGADISRKDKVNNNHISMEMNSIRNFDEIVSMLRKIVNIKLLIINILNDYVSKIH